MSIFGRLITGFAFIILLVLLANAYILKQVFDFRTISRQIIHDNQIIYNLEKMSEYFLSMLRNERQYLYFKDKTFYKYFEKARKNFDNAYQEALNKAQNPAIKEKLEKIAEIEEAYLVFCQNEFKELAYRSGITILKETNPNRKELTDEMVNNFKSINQEVHQEINNLISELDRQSSACAQAVVLAMIFAVMIILIMALILTLNITRPLYLVIRQTKEFAKGDFSRRLEIDSPPEIKRLADALNSMADKLQEVDRLKSDFFALISHDLKHPLASIQEGAALLKEGTVGELNKQQQKIVEIIQEEGNKLLKLIQDIMDLSKLEAGVMSFDFQEVDIRLVADKACKELEPLLSRNNLKLRKEFAPDLPWIKADILRLEQVFHNLLTNAIKFSPEGAEILVQIYAQDKGIVVGIKDQGPGIPQEFREHIFEKFTQVSKGPQAKGTGLGLAIVRLIVEAHGGRVWVESKEGEGSTFYFFLPSS